MDPDIELIRDRLASIKHKILVLSGKGGVGKSTVTASLAYALANLHNNNDEDGSGKDMMTNNKRQQQKPLQVAVLDIDICGPSQARMFGCEQESVHSSDEGWSPITVLDNLFLMSIAFLVESRNEAIIWRGPRKNALIKQFLRDVDWGQVDFLLVDTPPGTSDEHISIVQLLLQASALDGALIVTTPQEMSLLDVRKEVNFCVKTKVPILGVVENMAEFICPCCSTSSQLFPSTTGGAAQMCKELGLQLLAKLALDPRLGKSLDQGQQSYFEQFADSPVSKQFAQLAAAVLEKCEEKNSDDVENDEQPDGDNDEENGGG